MTDSMTKANVFKALHVKGDPLVLYNIWDAGTARIVAAAGAKAVATGSKPVASALGYEDGENVPLSLALENISRVVAAVDLPVTMDIEGGYGPRPEDVAATVGKVIAAGAVGYNLEDQVIGGSGLHETSAQATRIAAGVAAAREAGIPIFCNARTDLFLKTPRESHDAALVDQAVERAKAYADAGSDGFFAPGIADEALIGRLVEAIDVPVNIIALPGVPARRVLAGLGVARISWGPVPWRKMASWLEEEARAAISG